MLKRRKIRKARQSEKTSVRYLRPGEEASPGGETKESLALFSFIERRSPLQVCYFDFFIFRDERK